MSREPTTALLEPYLKVMVEKQASDLYFVTGAPPNMKTQGNTTAIAKKPFQSGQVQKLSYSLLNDEQVRDFEINRELNLGFTLNDVGRFRVNIFIHGHSLHQVGDTDS